MDFAFMVVEDMEEDKNYGPGGLFPVKLGDVLCPEGSASGSSRYRISAKLGHGSYSTVWLARDLVGRRTVAVKIVRASESATSREAAILKHLRTPISNPPAVVQLLDSFTVTSVNGIHQVLVTEPVILLQHLLELPGIQVNMRSLVRQAIEGLAFIHERGIAHGDLYPSNIGVAIPDLDSFSEVDIWGKCAPPTIVPLVACDLAHDVASFPPYLTHAIDLGELLVSAVPDFAAREPRVRILDLGCAYFAESPSPRCHTPRSYAAPEVAFPMIAHGNRDAPWDRHLPDRMRGGISSGAAGTTSWTTRRRSAGARQQNGLRTSRQYRTGSGQEPILPKWRTPSGPRGRNAYSAGGQTAEDARGLVTLLRRMLVIDPMERAPASELLQDPYLVGRDLTTKPSDHVPLPVEHPSPLNAG
ncbi:Protein kinase domain-containing protein [Mycena venus]|uniref:non-specific serine/threonine protein kinase n=1 Tax=Mycena venus TaxID=2733690 RepID=A0A8H6Y0A4_9AGAR|nr:Protein kinase domain-containing protein [Mycena venus]